MLLRVIFGAIRRSVPVLCVFFSHVVDAQMRLSESGHGEVLIFPFYSATPGEETELTITNHRNHAKAVTLRFREGLAGTEVLGFHVYLAPYDDFTASVVIDAEAGTAAVSTSDSSCTVPVLGSPNGNYSGTTTSSGGKVRRVQPFVPYLYLDDSNSDLGRTFAGSAEVIELGQWEEGSSIRNEGVFNDIRKSANGDRDGCDALNRNWSLGGVWYDNPKASASNWMGGGLSGKLTVRNQAGEMRISPIVIDGFARNKTTAEYHQSPGEAEAAWPSASLMNGSRTVLSPANGSLLTARSGLEAISILLTKTEVTALAANVEPNAQRGVILSFPTKWHHSTARLGSDALAPFTSKWDSQTSQACELVAVFDQAGPMVTFPYPADAQTLEVCSAVAVLSAKDAADQDSGCQSATFGSPSGCWGFGSNAGSEVDSNLNLPTYADWLGQFVPETGQYPWRLSFGSSDFMSQSAERWYGSSTQFKGLPAVVMPFAMEWDGGGQQIVLRGTQRPHIPAFFVQCLLLGW